MRINKLLASTLSVVLALVGITFISSPASAITLDMTGQSVSFGHGSPVSSVSDFTAGRYFNILSTGATDGSIVRYNSVASVSGTVVDVAVTTGFGFKPRVVTGISASGGTVTYTTATAHDFAVGQYITTQGNSPSAFNLSNVVVASVPTATTFTVTNAATGTFSSGGTAKGTHTVGSYDSATNTPDWDVDVTAGAVNSGVTFNFSFYEHGTYTGPNTGIPVVLKNITVNVADLDSGSNSASDEQFADFSGFQSYLLNKRAAGVCSGGDTSIAYNAATNRRCDDANLNVNPVSGTNLTRFLSTDVNQSSNIVQDIAAVKYDSFSSIDIKLGNIAVNKLGKYIVAFKAPTWGSYGAVTYTNTNNSPPTVEGDVPTFSVASNSPTLIHKTDFGTYYDFDNNPFYQVKIVTLPASGALQYFSAGSWTSVTANQVITVADLDLNKLRFTGASNTSFTFKVHDSLDYSTSSYTMNISPVANSQIISFANPGTKAPSAGTFSSGATSDSGLAVTLTSSTTGTCTVSDLDITVLTSGSCTIVASQAGNASYAAAAPVSQTFTISSKTSQTITFVDPGERTRDASDVNLDWASPKTSASSGLTVSLSSLTGDVCTISGTTIKLIARGTCSVRATQDGNVTYAAASPVDRTFQVVGTTYSLSFDGNTSFGSASTTGNVPSDVSSATAWQVAGNTGSPRLEKTGYSFAGWTENPDGTGSSYSQGDFVSLTANKTLYAKWSLISFTVTYQTTSSTGGSAPTATTGSGSIALATNSNSLARTHYYLSGWVIGGQHYDLGGSFNLTADVSAAPEWSQYTLSFLATNSTSGTAPSNVVDSGSITLGGAPDLQRSHYKFVGWSIGGTTYYSGDTYNLGSDQNATPIWGQYTVTYSAPTRDRGSVPSDTVGGESETLRTNTGNLERDGWYLAGWTIGGVDYSLGGSITLSADATATARWAKYTITFYNAGASSGNVPVSSGYSGSYTLPGNTGNLRRTGYEFSGWIIEGTAYSVGDTYTVSKNLNIFARWLRCGISYTAPHKVSGDVPPALTGCGNISLPKNTGNLTRTGWYFKGWSVAGVTLEPGATVTVTPGLVASAVWDRYTITYLSAEATSGSVPNPTLGFSSTTLASNSGNLKRTNYYFDGWVLGNVEYATGSTYDLQGNVYAFAKWKQYKINYQATDADSGSIPADAISLGYMSIPIATYGTLTRRGYLFAGWRIGARTYQPRDVFTLTGDVNAVAQWSQCVLGYNDGYSNSGAVPSSTLGCNNTLASVGSLARNTFYFSGWVVEGVLYQPGDSVTLTGNRTAYAQWKRYQISFLGTNSSNGSAPGNIYGYGTISTPRNPGTLARTGYYLSGWTINGTNYAFGSTIQLTADLVASPIWSQYNITYASSTSYLGTMPGKTYGYGSTATALNSSPISRPGYRLDGWIIGGVTYALGSNYNLTGNVTAIAKWTKI